MKLYSMISDFNAGLHTKKVTTGMSFILTFDLNQKLIKGKACLLAFISFHSMVNSPGLQVDAT